MGDAWPVEPRPGSTAAGAVTSLPTVEEVIRHRLATALGGWRGSVESALPVVAFVVLWTARHDLRLAVLASVAVVAALAVVRLVQRQSLRFIGSAALATAIAAFFALRSGRAEDAFLPGILVSCGYGVAALLSVLLRWPLVGFVVAAGDPGLADDPLRWRRDPAMVRVCSRLTWVLVATYAVRVAVMLPLYLAHEVTLLGVAKVALGWPLWLAAVAVMGALLVRGATPQQVRTVDSDATVADQKG